MTLIKGSYVRFGNYPQKANGERAPIEWLVLDSGFREALLISRYALDYKRYYNYYAPVTWEDCDLRKWLNTDFLQEAFSASETEMISYSNLMNDCNPKFGTFGGLFTRDRVFCLSYEEAGHFFSSDRARQCRATDYALTHTDYFNLRDSCIWWLRTPGGNSRCVSVVGLDGTMDLYGDVARNLAFSAVRPALRITL